jgi:hypothetical protein
VAVAPDVRTTLLDGSSLHRGSPASSRPPEFPPLAGLRPDPWRLPQVAPGPVEVTGDSLASADGARRSCPNAGPEGHGVRTVRA